MIIYLQPKTPFSKAVPRSDTLFGAICWSIRLLYGEQELTNLLANFQDNVAPFVLSSIFPFVQNMKGQKFLFFPRPMLPPKISELTSEEKYQKEKKAKKAKFVSQTVFAEMLNGRYEEKKDSFIAYAGVLMTQAEKNQLEPLNKLLVESEVARNTINRLTNATINLFHEPVVATHNYEKVAKLTGEVSEKLTCGFYFLVKIDSQFDQKLRPMLKAAISFLQEKGFGGNTSVGFGQCAVEISDSLTVANKPLFPNYSDGKQLVTLSLMFPNDADKQHLTANQEHCYGQLERRKGFLESAYVRGEIKQIWKPTLFMFSEGAVFPKDNNRQVYGKLFEEEQRAGLSFRVKINGLAYTVAMKKEV
ncbi:MAG: type III-A CRISPR-associated RAMP protein Csm4 [Blastocatellia bacterium]